MLRSTRFFAFAVLSCSVLVAACGDDDGEPAAVEPGTVVLRPAAFEPETVKVDVGDTVIWKWREKVSHNIIGEGGINKKVADGGNYTHTFEEKGTFDYRCLIHPGMGGSIVVE